MSSTLRATLILFVIAVIWGLTFPLIAIGIQDVSPGLFVLCRLGFAALLFVPILMRERKDLSWIIIKYAFFLGLFQGLCFLFQTIALETVQTASCAFISASSVVMVPFLAPLFGLKSARKTDIVAALVSASGIAVLTGMKLTLIHPGDLWSFAAAISYALVINMLQKVTKKYSKTLLIVSLQLMFTLPVPVLYAITDWHVKHWSWGAVGAIAYCAVMTTCLVFYLQTRYQHYIPVSRAAVIYAFEPLFATLFAAWIQDQVITLPVLMGGGLLLISFAISSLDIVMFRRLFSCS